MPNSSSSFTALSFKRLAAALALFLLVSTAASADDQIYFTAVDDVSALLVQNIQAETVRIDISAWYLSDDNVVSALLSRFKAGVPVRLIGDRDSIFEIDPPTKNEFYRLAAAGLPIRLRYNPTWYPEIDHWKATLFVGQNLAAFGSANYTPYQLAPFSSTNYDDETVLFTTDPTLFGALETTFDGYWNDTTAEPESLVANPPYFKNWNDACATETGCADYATQYPNPAPMVINTARLAPNNPVPADLIFGQGPDFNNRLVQEINNEQTDVDLVIYRLTVPDITNALLAKFQSRVPVRLIVEPGEYLDRKWPEFWLTHANVDTLWAAGIPILQRQHEGLTHMKTIVTSTYATNASSNFDAEWERDHNYFVSAATKPAIYTAIKNRFQTMWSDTVGFTPFTPLGPDAPTLATPLPGATSVPTTSALVWNIATFATSYDVYLGTSEASLALVGNVPAQMNNNPPSTYDWTPAAQLQPGTTYFWKIVSRTNATIVNPSLVASSSIESFTTGSRASGPAPAVPSAPQPLAGASGVSTTSAVLSWTSSGATSYDVELSTANPPLAQVASSLTAPSYQPGTLAASTTYYWQVTATSSAGITTGPVWSFTTAAGPPATPNTPSPANGATGVSSNATLTWAAAGATTYDVLLGTSVPPSQVATGLTSGSFSPSGLAVGGGTYFWQIVAHSSAGTTTGPVWSFTTVPLQAPPSSPGNGKGNPPGDFDGDGISDVAIFRPSTGAWDIQGAPVIPSFGGAGDIPIARDYDGDRKTDIAVFRPATGAWYIWQSSTQTGITYTWGGGSDIPVPADYDGDGKADIAVFRPATGVWYIWLSGTQTGITYTWGGGSDIPVPADYDGDGKTDIAVFRPLTGVWYIWQSSTQTPITYTWGGGSDMPVPADYDGDGKADIAVFRPLTGVWYIWQSSTRTGITHTWGGGSDIPVPGDYDGDGKTDIAVYRPSASDWFILKSSTDDTAWDTYQWGTAGDIPVLGVR